MALVSTVNRIMKGSIIEEGRFRVFERRLGGNNIKEGGLTYSYYLESLVKIYCSIIAEIFNSNSNIII